MEETEIPVGVPTPQLGTIIPKARPLLDSQTKERLEKIAKGFSEYFQLMANEPSVGLFHVQEHIRKTVPVMVKMQRDMKTTTQRIDEVKYDTAYSLRTVQGLHGLTTFINIKDMIVNCINVMKEIPSAQTPTRTPSFVSPPRSPGATPKHSVPASPATHALVTPTTPQPPTADDTTAPPEDEEAATTTSPPVARALFPTSGIQGGFQPEEENTKKKEKKKQQVETDDDLRPKEF